jgi:hypothetical protein
LGDEATYIVLLELPPSALAARLEAAGESEARALSPGHLVSRFFDLFPRQPLLRVLLEPGEGLWLSPWGVVHDGWTHGKRDLDVVLSIRIEVPEISHGVGADVGEGEGRQLRTRWKSRPQVRRSPSLHTIPTRRG